MAKSLGVLAELARIRRVKQQLHPQRFGSFHHILPPMPEFRREQEIGLGLQGLELKTKKH